MKIKSKFWIEDDSGHVVFGQGRADMLRAVNREGSINAAAKRLKMSFRGMWARIKATEDRLGLKLVMTDGQASGGRRGSRLTDEARELIELFEQLNTRGMAHADELFAGILDRLGSGTKLKAGGKLASGPRGGRKGAK